MATGAVDDARNEIVELRRRIEECRRELGISHVEPSAARTKRSPGLFRRGLRNSRQARRRATAG